MIILKKDLNFYKKDWNSEKRIHEYKLIKDITYVFHVLNEYIAIEEGFTLRHYFEVLKKYPELQVIDGFFPAYIKEYEETCCSPDFVMEVDDVDYLSLSKITSRDKGYLGELHNIEEVIDFSGWGFCNDEYSKGDFISWAIEYSPLKNLIDLEIRLDHHVVRIEKRDKRYEYEEYESGESHITIFEFFKEIIWELSFGGIPSERDETMKEIIDSKEELDEQLKNHTVDELIESGDLIEWKEENFKI